MMSILAIAGLAVRSAVRSRFLASLLVLMLAVVVGLPFTIQGDGTVTGHAVILLRYTLGLSLILLTVAATWLACAGVASDLSERRLDLVVVKPLHRWELWCGKWLGLVSVLALLVAASGGATWGVLRWTLRPGAIPPADRAIVERDVYRTREVIAPDFSAFDADARRRLDAARRAGTVPPGLPDARAYSMIRTRMAMNALTVGPGDRQSWTFRLPAGRAGLGDWGMRYRFASSLRGDTRSIPGAWTIRPEGATGSWSQAAGAPPELVNMLAVPASAVSAGAGGAVSVQYRNAAEAGGPSIIFYQDGGLELLVPRDGLGANFVRALLMVLFGLAFVAALGLAAGSLFSLPVAVFVSACALVVLAFGGYIESVVTTGVFYVPHHADIPEMTAADRAFMALFRGLDLAVRPLTRFDPLGALAASRYIPWSEVGRAFLTYVVYGSGALGLAASLALRRKEVGRPTE